MATTTTFHHPILRSIEGILRDGLLRFTNIPYATIPRHFARSSLLQHLPRTASPRVGNGLHNVYDATDIPPASIQPVNASANEVKGCQIPPEILDGFHEEQSEDCLRLSITVPAHARPGNDLPVLVFVHGGAFFLGSTARPYYDPSTLSRQALEQGEGCVFVGVNYRLGALGFAHLPGAHGVPENNGLYDQRIAFEWVRRFIAGFGGNVGEITALGQSAGGMSLTAHDFSGLENVWRRRVVFSGSLVTMPVKDGKEKEAEFRSLAEKTGVMGVGVGREEAVEKFKEVDVGRIRDAAGVGLLCVESEMLPYSDASMKRMSTPAAWSNVGGSAGLESQIVSSTTYDGGISYNLMIENKDRKGHAKAFFDIANSSGLSYPQELLDLYKIETTDDDPAALRKICQFETDIGFFAASLAQARGFSGKSYLLLFDLGSPFEGFLPAGECATHTWDVIAMLGSCEKWLEDEYRTAITDLRDRLLRFSVKGEEPWPAWTEDEGEAMVIGKEGLSVLGFDEYMGAETRRGKLLELAEKEAGDDGPDLLWSEVCRRFLMAGH